jgi:hypothetical protein
MLWGGALPRTIPGQQMVADVRGLAARLNLTDEQAYQLYQIFIQSGGQLRPGTGPLGPLPPTYVIPPTTPPPQAPPQVPPQTPPPRTTPPDPLAMRRQRRQRRHDDD